LEAISAACIRASVEMSRVLRAVAEQSRTPEENSPGQHFDFAEERMRQSRSVKSRCGVLLAQLERTRGLEIVGSAARNALN
jgi:hypothetical protein